MHASDAYKIADEKRQARKLETETKNRELFEKFVLPAIEQAISEGKFEVKFKLPSNAFSAYPEQLQLHDFLLMLRLELGYDVLIARDRPIDSYYVTISWKSAKR